MSLAYYDEIYYEMIWVMCWVIHGCCDDCCCSGFLIIVDLICHISIYRYQKWLSDSVSSNHQWLVGIWHFHLIQYLQWGALRAPKIGNSISSRQAFCARWVSSGAFSDLVRQAGEAVLQETREFQLLDWCAPSGLPATGIQDQQKKQWRLWHFWFEILIGFWSAPTAGHGFLLPALDTLDIIRHSSDLEWLWSLSVQHFSARPRWDVEGSTSWADLLGSKHCSSAQWSRSHQ